MITEYTQKSKNFQDLQQKLQKTLQTSFCKYENAILRYEEFVAKILSLFTPNIVCKYNDDELYNAICNCRFNDYKQRQIFGQSFYEKKANGRFIEIDASLINASEIDIEMIKYEITLLEKGDNQTKIFQLKSMLSLIEYAKIHKTSQYPCFDLVYNHPPQDFVIQNKKSILERLYKDKKFMYFFEKKTSFSIYDLIDWQNIKSLATFDARQFCECIKEYSMQDRKELKNKIFGIDEVFNFTKLIGIYESSSFNKKAEVVNVIGSMQNKKIDWRLNENFYKISIFTMIKASKSLKNEKNSWDVDAFENAIKEWSVKEECLKNNIEGLSELYLIVKKDF